MVDSYLEAKLNKLFTEIFPYQFPKWFSKVIAQWTWLIVPAIIIVQPWVGWGYWDDVHGHSSGPNFFFVAAFMVSALEIGLQLLALSHLKKMRRMGWLLMYYSGFCIVAYGIMRMFSSQPSIGPLFGMTLLSVIFYYCLFQIRPWFK